jgi:hypothetical protein
MRAGRESGQCTAQAGHDQEAKTNLISTRATSTSPSTYSNASRIISSDGTGHHSVGVEARPVQHLTALTFTSTGEDGAVACRALTHKHSEVWVPLSRTADISQIRQKSMQMTLIV